MRKEGYTPCCSLPARLSVTLPLLLIFFAGCIKGTPLASKSADRMDVTGIYDLMLYGCRFPNDLETAAFLVDPAKAEQFDLYVLPTSYKVIKGLAAESAFEQADAFLHCGVRTVEKTVIRSVPDGAGGTIGYEVLPHYSPLDVGGQRPLIVNYSLRNGKITVFINLDPAVRMQVDSVAPPGPGGP